MLPVRTVFRSSPLLNCLTSLRRLGLSPPVCFDRKTRQPGTMLQALRWRERGRRCQLTHLNLALTLALSARRPCQHLTAQRTAIPVSGVLRP
jgi:hypothetical protein